MSTPISATMAAAVSASTPGLVISKACWAAKGRMAAWTAASTSARSRPISSKRRMCILSSKRWCSASGPSRASRSSLRRRRRLARSAMAAGAAPPSAKARSISMPDTPNTLLITPASLMPAPSSSVSVRLRSAAMVPTSALRWPTRSRRTLTSGGGTKLGRTSPWRTRSAIHSASFTSVLRPGTLRMCEALPTMTVKSPSRPRGRAASRRPCPPCRRG